MDDPDASVLLLEETETSSPVEYALAIRPFSPFDAGLSTLGHHDSYFSVGSPQDHSESTPPVPPLPPKIPISH